MIDAFSESACFAFAPSKASTNAIRIGAQKSLPLFSFFTLPTLCLLLPVTASTVVIGADRLPTFMAAWPDPERTSHRLHNFAMPSLKWENQRLLRSINVNPSIFSSDSDDSLPQLEPCSSTQTPSNHHRNSLKPVSHSPPPPSSIEKLPKLPPLAIKPDDGIEKVREKLLVHLRALTSIEDGEKPEEEELVEKIPWNLRTRRAAYDAPIETSNNQEKPRLDDSPPLPTETRPKSLRLRGLAPEKVKDKRNEIPKFSISLTRDEIEEDFLAMTQAKPPRRPKKRPRIVQNKLDDLFPGLWLSNITLDSYKVSDLPESNKK